MRTFTIILADDEKQILQGMLLGIPWSELGFRVVATAENGREALEFTQEYHPDVLFSDIKMPFMTGIELAQKIHEDFMQIKMVLFSGFEEFEYARSAIRYGVADYMLKPINYTEMKELLKKLHKELEEEYHVRSDLERRKKLYMDSIPLLRQQYLMDVLHSDKDAGNRLHQLEMVGVRLDKPYMQVMLVSIPEAENDIMTAISVAEMINEMLEKVCRFYSFRYSDKMIYLLNYEQENGQEQILKTLNEAAHMSQKFLDSTFSCGIGNPADDLRKLPVSYQQAKEALEYNLVLEDEVVSGYHDLILYDDVMVPNWKNHLKDLENSIKYGKEADVRKKAEALLEVLRQCHYNFTEYQMAVVEIVFSFAKLYKRYDDSHTDEKVKMTALKILSMHDGMELNNWLLNHCILTNGMIRTKEIDQNGILAQQAKEYVDQHYSDPELSVDTICGIFHISSSHFSKIFRKEFGTSFLSYLTDKRMEEAEKLLLTTDYKSRKIGEMVGYLEPNYFSYVFKKNRNISPSKYRKQRKNEHE